MKNSLSRRSFVNKTIGLSTGVFILPSVHLPGMQQKASAIRPLIITSHTNETGRKAMEAGWKILMDGGNAVDAVEKAANVIEVDPKIQVSVTVDYLMKKELCNSMLHLWMGKHTPQVLLPAWRTLKHLLQLLNS